MYTKEIIYTEKRLDEVLKASEKSEVFSFDIETSPVFQYEEVQKAALNPHLSEITTLSFCTDVKKGYVVPLNHVKGTNIDLQGSNQEKIKKLVDKLRPILENESITKVIANITFEAKFFTKHLAFFINVADPITMAARYLQLKDPEKLDKGHVLKGLGLKDQSFKFLNITMKTFSETLGKEQHFKNLDIKEGCTYAIEDSINSLKLFYYWKEKLEKIIINDTCNDDDIGRRPYKNYYEFLHGVEMPVSRVVGFMEYFGLGYDRDQADKKASKMQGEIDNAIFEIVQEGKKLGLSLNPGKTGKTKDIRNLLFQTLNCPTANISEKTGAPSLDTEAIEDIMYMLENRLSTTNEIYTNEKYKDIKRKYGVEHTNKDLILKILKNIKIIQKNGVIISSHIKGRVKYIDPVSQRIHSQYCIWTNTSRFSSSKPNAQNIPAKRNDVMGVRNLYEPRKDNILLLIDYAAQEVRIGAELYKDETMINGIKHGWDMHSFTAKEMFNLDVDLTDGSKVAKKYRDPAKPAMFTKLYGGGPHALQKTYKGMLIYKSEKECNEVMKALGRAYPGIAEFAERTIIFAEENGYVETMLGYRRLLTNINSSNKSLKKADERRAVNTPVQGTAADVTKVAMNRIYNLYLTKEISAAEVKIVATIHDEIAFEIVKMDLKKLDKVVKLLKSCMEEKIIPDQIVLHKAEPEIADPHDIYQIGESNGWAEKYDFYVWRKKHE